jgi:hypothetical protein
MKKAEFKKGDTVQFLGFNIKYCTNNDGIVLMHSEAYKTLPDGYTHLGNFSKLEDAQEAAIFYYMIARPAKFHVHMYRFATGGGTWGEYAVLKDSLKADGMEMPEEITYDMSNCILFNGNRMISSQIQRALKGEEDRKNHEDFLARMNGTASSDPVDVQVTVLQHLENGRVDLAKAVLNEALKPA